MDSRSSASLEDFLRTSQSTTDAISAASLEELSGTCHPTIDAISRANIKELLAMVAALGIDMSAPIPDDMPASVEDFRVWQQDLFDEFAATQPQQCKDNITVLDPIPVMSTPDDEHDPDYSCCICSEPLLSDQSPTPTVVKMHGCRPAYHLDCLCTWWESSGTNTCPHCRAVIPEVKLARQWDALDDPWEDWGEGEWTEPEHGDEFWWPFFYPYGEDLELVEDDGELVEDSH
ncbi:hypothetical protein P171DRAFT_479603 [Karstenula rhodostoma CBS 690.94]|uniref:RING-type domain-containing protein n=1 Tax=Karstenula rhodostoma CBS 690.94 TaxID=1392251 RepID=A0A9P4UIP5_9PLEO|nr:hypothetical protein P171DRAFT_479603 [Karstenula rhodostoma CBS 690.94]